MSAHSPALALTISACQDHLRASKELVPRAEGRVVPPPEIGDRNGKWPAISLEESIIPYFYCCMHGNRTSGTPSGLQLRKLELAKNRKIFML